MTTLEVLEGARDLIREKDKWFGKDSEWREDRRCVLTACSEAAGFYDCIPPRASAGGAWAALGQVVRDLGFHTGQIVWYNDTHTHAEVLELFNIAIANELAKTKQPVPPKVRMATYNGHLPELAAASEARVTPEAALA